MIKRVMIRYPNYPSWYRLYFYKDNIIHYRFGNDKFSTGSQRQGKTLEECIDEICYRLSLMKIVRNNNDIYYGLEVITDDNEIARILTMHELVN